MASSSGTADLKASDARAITQAGRYSVSVKAWKSFSDRVLSCSDGLHPGNRPSRDDISAHEKRSIALSSLMELYSFMRESSKDELDEVLGPGMAEVRESNGRISDFYRFPKSIEWRTVEPLSLVDSLIPQSRFTRYLLDAVGQSLEEEEKGLTATMSVVIEGHPAKEEYKAALKRVEEEYTLLTLANGTLDILGD